MSNSPSRRNIKTNTLNPEALKDDVDNEDATESPKSVTLKSLDRHDSDSPTVSPMKIQRSKSSRRIKTTI